MLTWIKGQRERDGRAVTRRSRDGAVPAVLALIFVCTLWPFRFGSAPGASVRELMAPGIGPDLGGDVLVNVLLFVPLGMVLSGVLRLRRMKPVVAVTVILVAGLCLSYTIEVLQHFIPGRVSSLSDVLANGAGAVLGFIGHRLWLGENDALDVAAYAVAMVLLSLPLQWATTIRDWYPDLPLVVGNEHTANRPWRGQVFAVSIFDRALAAEEVPLLQGASMDIPSLAGSRVASYDLTGPCTCVDQAGQLPPLISKAHYRETSHGTSAQVGDERWLETSVAASELVNRIERTARFTVALTAATRDTNQTGRLGTTQPRGRPARILSYSSDPYFGNFMVGQRRDDLVFHFNTLLTGGVGDRPSLVVPDVFATRATRHIVFTYDGLDLAAYVDGVRSEHSVRFGLGAGAFSPYLGDDKDAYYLYDVAYCAMVFIPAGILIARMTPPVKRKAAGVAVAAAAVVACVLSFEAVLVSASGRPVNVSNLVWSAMLSGSVVAKKVIDQVRVS